MAKVKISTKYALSDEALALCNKARTWWMRNRTSGEFVKIPYTPANQTFEFELDLPDAEYQCSCGDYNAVDSNGRHCTQNIYFYVKDGKLTYVKRKDEFPSVAGGSTEGGAQQATFNPFATNTTVASNPATTPGPQTGEGCTYEPIESVLYCKKNKKVVTPDYTCVVDYVSDNTAVTGLDCCESCLHKQVLFVKVDL